MNRNERIKMVKAMEYIARQVNDEQVFYGWLLNGVADGDIPYGDFTYLKDPVVDTADFAEGYTDDESFAELMGCFLRTMRRAEKSGGLWCDDVLSR